jgi:hypothetical protein
VPPFAARWFLLRMRSGPVTAELVRREALALQQNRRSGHAAQRHGMGAAEDVRSSVDDEHDDGAVATSPPEATGGVGDSVAPSASGSEITAKRQP